MTPHETQAASRRTFLKTSAGALAGLVISFRVRLPAASPITNGSPRAKLPAPDAFLHIAPDDSITVFLAHSEMGQGVWTGLPMLLAEELGCDWQKVQAKHALAAPAYAHTAYGMQMTGGSTSTWSEFDRYRQVGAMARTMLIEAAAKQWGVEAAACRVDQGSVVHSDKKLTFGQLAEAAMRLTPPTEVTLEPPAEWKLIGKPTRRLDSALKVTGRAEFGFDVKLPGLLTALVARAPVFGGKVKSFKADAAKAVDGVRGVYQVPSGIAVVADHFWAAKKGRDALTIEWDHGAGASLSTDALRAEYRAMAKKPGLVATTAGDAAAQIDGAAQVVSAEYEAPYLPHAPMEPLNCTVRLRKDSCEIWTGTQFQTPDQAAAAHIAGLKPEQVTLHTTFLGGGFGRRANPACDFVAEAVHVAKAAGAPVKTVWTREDDVRGGYYRPMALHSMRVGLGDDGLPVGWHHRVVCQSIVAGTPFAAVMIKNGVDGASVEGVADSPYVTDMPHHHVELHSPILPVPVLWWRSVGHSHSAFAMESFIDELAHAAKIDPIEYRRRLLKKHPRHLGALNLAVEKANLGPATKGKGYGVAVHESFGSYVAHVAEVTVTDGRIKVERVVVAIDCGVCVNPLGVAAQLEGGTAFGLTAALYGELNIEAGQVKESNFHNHPLLRFHEMPKVEAHIVPSSAPPGGVGEPGVPPIAAAVGNAVFVATGQRLRRLPLRLAK